MGERPNCLLFWVLLQEQIGHLRSESESMMHFPPLQSKVQYDILVLELFMAGSTEED